MRGATKIVMFTGIMDAQKLQHVLEVGLLPFIRERFPRSHRLFHDNDPKHASKAIELRQTRLSGGHLLQRAQT